MKTPDEVSGKQDQVRKIRKAGEKTGSPAAQEDTVVQAVQAALREAEKEDVILAFGSLSYLHQIKEAYDRAVCKKRDER